MTKNSVASLSETLQQRLLDDQLAVNNQTSLLLKQHAEGLQKLSAAALNTTKSATQRQILALDQLHAETLKRLRWLMLWPLLASVVLCLSMVAGASLWSWWKLSEVDDQVLIKQQQIKQLEATFCASPSGLKICRGVK